MLDGWWIEGCIEGVTGWAIGSQYVPRRRTTAGTTMPIRSMISSSWSCSRFLPTTRRLHEVMRHAIALNGSFFNTQRMVQQYVVKVYFL